MKRKSLSTRILACILVLTFAFSGLAASKTSKVYDNAIDKMSEGAYADAAELFDSISSYEDASTLGMYCKAIALAQDGYYDDAISAFDFFGDYKDCRFLKVYYSAMQIKDKARDDPLLYLDAADMFETIRLYKDSVVQAKDCREKLHETATNILKDVKDPVLDMEQLEGGYLKLTTSENYLEKLESYIDVQTDLERVHFLLGEYYFYAGNSKIAEDYFRQAGEENPVVKEWLERSRKFSDLAGNLKAAVCDSDGYPLLELKSAEELFFDDVEDNQMLKLSLELTNKGEPCNVKVAFTFLHQEDTWFWNERMIDAKESCAFRFSSSEEELKNEFTIGQHTCVWLVDDYPFMWYQYEINEGISDDKKNAKELADSLKYEFIVETHNELTDSYTKNDGETLFISDLYDGESYIPVFKITNETDEDVQFNLSCSVNGIDIGWDSEPLKKGSFTRYIASDMIEKPGDYTFKYYVSSCLVGEYSVSVKEEPEISDTEEALPQLGELADSSIGDIVTFGAYEQDNDLENGKEPIEWIVLDKKDGKALLLSRYALDSRAYHHNNVGISWETSNIRKWLNTQFARNAFTPNEINTISDTTVKITGSFGNETNFGNEVTDKLFLLNIDEAKQYFLSDEDRSCKGTEYCYAQGAFKAASNGNCCWWLLLSGKNELKAPCVNVQGAIYSNGSPIQTTNRAVRPAIWVKIDYSTNTVENEDAEKMEVGVETGKEASVVNEEIPEEKESLIEDLSTVKVGDDVLFGSYEQDNNLENAKEPIEWIVLETEGNRALLISKYALSFKEYNSSTGDTSWEECDLRDWLNYSFLKEAFAKEEQEKILNTKILAETNPDYSYQNIRGTDVIDKIFLLSINEANKYFSSDSERQCKSQEFEKKGEKNEKTNTENNWWWLRSPGSDFYNAAYINRNGSINKHGRHVYDEVGGVRPALWIKYDSESAS